MIDKYFKTNDGVKLHYIEGGEGYPLVIVHGWKSEAVEYCHNLEELSKYFHVYFLEHRGHGSSEKVSFGHRISRLAMDLNEFLCLIEHDKVNIICHSMGCGVVWNYIDLFGQERINKLICIDIGPFMLKNPEETKEENDLHGAVISDIWGVYNKLSISMEEGDLEYNKQVPEPPDDISTESKYYQQYKKLERTKLDNKFHAPLFFNMAANDWRDVIKRIYVPTLYIAGETSRVNTPTLTKWYKENLSNVKVVTFSREEYGRHGLFCSNPIKFNEEVTKFLSE